MWRTHTDQSSYVSTNSFGSALLVLAVATTAALLNGCGAKTSGDTELQWARAALERNPQVKVVSIDAATNSIQVQVKASGETIAVTPGELAAIPIADLVALTQTASREPPIEKTPPPAPPVEAAPEPQTPPEPVTESQPAKPAYDDFVVERENGRVRVTGPGVSIESPPAPVTEGVSQRVDEPIVCDGKRMMRMDARQLNVDGNAITVRGGCELYISNSRIQASSAAIVVDNGIVHISNSEISGAKNSLVTNSAARAYLRSNTFSGLQIRDPDATIVDQGGNTWR